MKKSLTRSIPYWLLLVLSLASAGVGAWFISDNSATMTTKLLDGTATGVEVYVGQPMIVVGAALVGAGVIGVLLTLALAAAKSLVPAPAPVAAEPIDWSANADDAADASTDSVDADAETIGDDAVEADAQNGSSGSTATATNSNVR